MKVLVLNADYNPFDVWSWQKAMSKLLCSHTIYSVKDYDRTIRDGSGNTYLVPAVVALKKFISVHNRPAPYGKSNIYARDLNICQYCGTKTNNTNRTVDHIVPRSLYNPIKHKFKLNSFDNVVTACRICNVKKGDNELHKAGMSLLQTPKRISRIQAYRNKLILYGIAYEWLKYIKYEET